MKRFRQDQIGRITAPQWARLSPILAQPGRKLEPAFLRSAAGLTQKTAVALILLVGEQRAADLRFIVYHGEHVAEVRAFKEGFREVPWECPECEEVIEDAEELRYELQATLKTPVEFV